MKKYDVVGVGSLLTDYIINVDYADLDELSLKKGSMHLIDDFESTKIFRKYPSERFEIMPGGCIANTIAGLATLGGTSALIGKIGDDDIATRYIKKTTDSGVETYFGKYNGVSGHAITFITPDKERTFATNLGASLYFSEKDLSVEAFEALQIAKIFHIEGYLLENDVQFTAVQKAVKIAQAENCKIALDLADPALIQRQKSRIYNFVHDYVDIVFANEDEASAFTGLNDERKSVEVLAENTEIAVVKVGKRGSIISAEGKHYEIPALGEKVVNKNGAGDSYAAGFLYGLTHGLTIEKAGLLGSYFSSLVIAQAGARLDYKLDFEQIKNDIIA